MIAIDTKALLDAAESAERGERGPLRRPRRRRTGLLGRSLQSIAGRLGFASVALSGMLVMLGLILSFAFLQLASRNAQVRDLAAGSIAAAELTASIADARYHAARAATADKPGEIGRAREALADARGHLAGVKAGASRMAGAPASLARLEQQLRDFDTALTGPGRAAAAGPLERDADRLAGTARSIARHLAAFSDNAAETAHRFNTMVSIFITALIVLATLIAVSGSRFLARDISGALGKITVAMTGLAAGNRGIAVPGAERGDEIGEMARALVVFRHSAEELAALQEKTARAARLELRRHEEAQSAQARLIDDLAGKFERTVGEVASSVAAASSQLQDTAAAMAAAAGQASSSAGEVVHSMDSTSASVNAAASASDQFALSVGEISRQAVSSADLARDARISAEEADTTIAELNRANEQVGAIVELIGSIAERTDMLALNASIEAARGGEAGRGFAVVAAEVKELARRTSEATSQVSDHIAAIQRTTRASVAALRKIEQQIRQVETNATTIAQAVDEQTIASQELARNLVRAAGGTEAVRTSIGRVRAMALTTGSAASQVLAAAGGLQDQATALRFQVEDFLGYVRAA